MLRQSLKSPAENKRILSCERNLTPVYGTHIVICVILGRKKSRNMCQNALFPCLQGIRMRRSTKEEQKTDA